MSEGDQLNAARVCYDAYPSSCRVRQLTLNQSAIASICLFIIANALSKCSVIFFMKRLFSTDNRTARILCNSLLGLVAVWTLASILALTITCGPSTKFALQDRCSGQVSLMECYT